MLIDGVSVRDYTLDNLRGGIGVALQESVLFTGSISENLRWGNDDATDEDDCCIGALLDGRANCDGYADALLLVGRLAGLNVRYQHGDSLNGGMGSYFSTHMWNLIELDGAWRMIDANWDDGSMGTKGYPSQGLAELLKEGGFETVFCCGPMPLMRSVAQICAAADVPCQVSLEERMGCGFGICVGCVVDHKAADGTVSKKRVCYDGPVFEGKEVFWND